MKKLISILLVCVMLFLGNVSVFAAETDEAPEIYDLSKLFVNYEEKDHGLDPDDYFAYPEVKIYISGNYKNAEVWNAFYSRLTDEHSKYIILNTSRPTTPGASDPFGTIMLGEKGNKSFYIDFTDEFFSYIKTLDRLDGNVLIMDFLMNLLMKVHLLI